MVIALPDKFEVRVPELGKVDEVNLIEWKVSPGDEVTEGMEVAEIETMKSTFSVDAPATGLLEEVFVEPGEEVALDEVLATIKPH